jgi:ligand-binding sensor domain-containing protein
MPKGAVRIEKGLLLLAFLLASYFLHAQSDVRIHSFTEEQGLAQNFVYDIRQDHRGFLWISTGAGVSRYDGHELKNFSQSDGLADNFITTSYLSRNKQLVLGHYQGSISIFNGVYFQKVFGDSLNSEIVSIDEDAQGNVWCFSKSKGMIMLNAELKNPVIHFPGELRGKIVYQAMVVGSNVWMGTSEGFYLFEINNAKLLFVNDSEGLRTMEVTAIGQQGTDSVHCLAGTADGELYRLKLGNSVQIESSYSEPLLSGKRISSLLLPTPNELWVGTSSQSVYTFTLSKTDLKLTQNFESQINLQSVSKIYRDQSGATWVGTLGKGIHKIELNRFSYLDLASWGVTRVHGAAATSFGYWVATDAGLLKLWVEASGIQRIERELQFGKKEVLSVFALNDQLHWVGTTDGIYKWNSKIVASIKLASDDGMPVRARFFRQGTNESVWVSAIGNGVYELDGNGKVLQHFSTTTGFMHNDIFAIHADQQQRVWFGSQGAGLARVDQNGNWKMYSQQNIFPSRDVNDITEDHQGVIWVATDGQGLFRYEKDSFQHVVVSSTQQAGYIKGVMADEKGLWLSYRNGITFYNIKTNKSRAFTSTDGLLNSETYASSMVSGPHQQILFLNETGVTLFHDSHTVEDVRLVPQLTAIRLFFNKSIQAEPSQIQSAKGTFPSVELQFDQNHLTFDFSAVNLNYTGTVFYRYRVKEIEQEWAPPITQNSITYTSINPGNYTLLVQASNDPQNWSDPILEYSFTIRKPYWQQAWFYLVQVVSICLLFGITYFVSRSDRTRLSVLRIMVFVCLFIVFEFLQNWIDPFTSSYLGQAPIYRTVLNLVLALLLLPVERLIRIFFTGHKQLPQDWD